MKYFMASLCKNGILGGRIVADTHALTYQTSKLTVPDKYKNLQIPYQTIISVEKGGFFPFPTVTLHLQNDTSYKFIVFARKRFLDILQNAGVSI